MEVILSRSDQLRRLYRPARKVDPGQPGSAWLARFDEADLEAEIAPLGADDDEGRLEQLVRRMVEERLAGGAEATEPALDPVDDSTSTVELRPEGPTGALEPLAKLWNRVLVVRAEGEQLEDLPLDSRLLLAAVDGHSTMAALRAGHPELTDEAFVVAIRAAASRRVLRFRKG